ncbi:MAG: DNA-processing protein DprA [Rhodobacteraceae bacterium]|nr:DNA-processing protein DprA [Paracoccaceae bacterium]
MSWLRLIRSRRIGVATFYRLLDEYGSARAALLALPEVAKAAGENSYEPCPEGVVLAEMRAGKAAGARLVCRGEAGYPELLGGISDPPPLLWMRGDTALAARPMIALVGSLNASSLGTRMARKMAADLGAAGVTIVSGLARGIDAAAHLAALPTGTIAVMAGGLDRVYPAENTSLYGDILHKGLALSEQAMGTNPVSRHFPQRNRIVSGLCLGVVVIEAAARSGSLITARTALEQGREVLAVPGHPFDGRAAGCNMLIRDGAQLVRGADDVLEALKLAGKPDAAAVKPKGAAPAPEKTAPAAVERSWRDIAALHRQILDRLGPSPVSEDQLIRDLALPASAVAPELTTLELEGRVHRHAGGLLSRLD